VVPFLYALFNRYILCFLSHLYLSLLFIREHVHFDSTKMFLIYDKFMQVVLEHQPCSGITIF